LSHLSIKSRSKGRAWISAMPEVGNISRVADPGPTVIDLDPIVLVGFRDRTGPSASLRSAGLRLRAFSTGREVVGAVRLIAALAETRRALSASRSRCRMRLRDSRWLSAELVIRSGMCRRTGFRPRFFYALAECEVGVKW